MRVLVVSHTYITPINRKKWQMLATLFSDVNITVLFPTRWGATLFDHAVESDLSSFNSGNCSFIALEAFKTGNEVLYGYNPLKLVKLIRRLSPDIIHVEQGDNAFSYFQCILFTKLLRLKSKILFFTWVNWKQKFSFKYKIFWRWLERFNLKYSNGAIVGNSGACGILRDKGFARKTFILPQLGVDTSVFTPVPREYAKLKKIGFVGRLVEEKGIFDLLEAFASLAEKFPDWQLVFIGRGPCAQQLKSRISSMGIIDRISIEDTVPHDKVALFIQNLEILVLPSYDVDGWREQFGHVLIEAMACKVPVIGSDAGEIPSVIAGVGLVFNQKNKESLRKALCKLINDEILRMELGQRGYEKAINEYSNQAIAKKTYNFWREITKN